ncbi:hypothetical protein F4777DRAFT_551458 [Nemania sp. FL0916]|nr:hypothetical protein F4777DRAFT_551458 [Nemania sp. FL0916]
MSRALARQLRENKHESADERTNWVMSLIGGQLLATNPKDHIYGLLALTKINIVPDYGEDKSISDVYCDYVQGFINFFNSSQPSDQLRATEKPLYFLNYGGIGVYENVLRLPSWAPNFPEESQKHLEGNIMEGVADSGLFDSSSQVPAVIRSQLVVSAVELDTISRIQFTPHKDTWIDKSFLIYIKDFVRRNPTYITGIPSLRAILHSITFNTTLEADDDLVEFEYGVLDTLLSTDMENRAENLEALGLGFEDSFNPRFSSCILPGSTTWERRWWKYLWEPDEDISEFHSTIIQTMDVVQKRFRFCETGDGHVGLAPLGARPGDVICVLNGSGIPALIRSENGRQVFVGLCIIMGIMNGEAKTLVTARGLQIRTLKLF